jgi:hypothetical protein
MVVLEEPYISDTLISFLENEQVPVLKNEFLEKIFLEHPKLNVFDDKDIVDLLKKRFTAVSLIVKSRR